MKVVEYIPDHNPAAELTELINESFTDIKTLPAFDSLNLDFLSALSKKILDHPEIKTYPELVALAYWLRKSNLRTVAADFKNNIADSEMIVPRGLAFHIAPSNVDSIFLYSWTLSLLAGNTNVIRISQNINPQLGSLLDIIKELINDRVWAEIKSRNIIITYPRDNEINTYISSRSDVRVLWGGDETVGSLKILPAKPGTKDILFSDKFSYTAVDALIYISLDDNEKKLLARNFCNDAYWFDQMACSSPRFVLFIGPRSECESSSTTFWELLAKELEKKKITDTPEIAVEKLTYMFETISKTDLAAKSALPKSGKPTVLRVKRDEIKRTRESCGGGFFFECFLNDLEELIPLVNRKDQTLTYFGFFKDKLKLFASKVNGRGIDRIVPIGQALNFSPIWDGYSLLNELTKRVSIIA